jgi:hypothetical protein
VIANGHTEKDRRRTTDPDIGATTNRRNPDWTRWLHAMVVRVENGYQVSDRAIVTDYDAMIGHDRGETANRGGRRTLSNDYIPSEVRIGRSRTGVETILDLVKSDAIGTA